MKRVLIVDDEIAVATVFEAALRSAGYDVKLAPDAKTGLATAQGEKFDLVLMDQMMPDMSGNEALKTLKSDPTTAAVPVAMLTNFGHDTMVKEALNSNAADYILKYQISNDGLVERVKAIIGDANGGEVSSAQAGQVAQATADVTPSTPTVSAAPAAPDTNNNPGENTQQ